MWLGDQSKYPKIKDNKNQSSTNFHESEIKYYENEADNDKSRLADNSSIEVEEQAIYDIAI